MAGEAKVTLIQIRQSWYQTVDSILDGNSQRKAS